MHEANTQACEGHRPALAILPTIDYTRLSWGDFENLVCDLLDAEGFINVIKAGGSGGDMGMDICAEEIRHSLSGRVSAFRWMIQAKHYAGATSSRPGRSSTMRNVGHREIADIIGFLSEHSADGFLLVTDTGLTASAAKKITAIHTDTRRREEAHFWDNRVLSDRLRKHPELVRRYFGTAFMTAVEPCAVKNPFRFLEPFTAADHRTFFGRTQEIEELVGLLCNTVIAVIFGESGTGKSSLLNAALLPAMANLRFFVGKGRCLDDPARALRTAVLHTLERVFSADRLTHLGSTATLSEFLERLYQLLEESDARMVVAIDQFEELFTRADSTTQQQFARAVNSLLSSGRACGRLSLLLVIREDFLGNLWEWSVRNRLKDPWTNTYRVRRLSRSAARLAIDGPLLTAGVTLEPEATSGIINDLERLGNGWTFPPYLQIVFGSLFDSVRSDPGKTLAQYENMGRAEGIILDFFDSHLFSGLSPEYQAIAKSTLDALTGADGMRTLLPLSDIGTAIRCQDFGALEEVIDILVTRRAISPRSLDGGSTAYELVHDFLAKSFFEKLDPRRRKEKGILEVLRKAVRDWQRYGIKASQSALDEFFSHEEALSFGVTEWECLLASAASAGRLNQCHS